MLHYSAKTVLIEIDSHIIFVTSILSIFMFTINSQNILKMQRLFNQRVFNNCETQIILIKMDEMQTIYDRNSKYNLAITFKDQIINIQLLLYSEPYQLFVKRIAQSEIPPQLQFLIGDINLIYQCFHFPYEVLVDQGAIKVTVKFQFKTKQTKRQIIRQAIIPLQKQQLTKQQILQIKLSEMLSEVQMLKIDKNKQTLQMIFGSNDEVKIQNNNEGLFADKLQNKIAIMKQSISLTDNCLDDIYENNCNKLKQANKLQNSNLQLLVCTRNIIKQIRAQQVKKQYRNQENVTKVKQHKKQIANGNTRIVNNKDNTQNPIQAKPIIKIPIKPFIIIKEEPIQKNTTQQVRALQKPGSKKYIIKHNKITHVGPSNQNNQIVLRMRLRLKGKKQFKVKVLKTQMRHIYIGIVDKTHSRSKRTNNVICYFGFDGEIWDHKPIGLKGGGFCAGDTVQVQISKGQIVWKVNDSIVVAHESDKLNDENCVFYPFFEMVSHGDCLEWVQ